MDDYDEELYEEETLTPAELIDKLKQCWLNEKFAPKLLPYQAGIVEGIIDQIRYMEENINSAKKGDFRITVHRLELDRIKFMIYSYMRNRLQKIEKYAFSIVEEDRKRGDAASKLSPEEYAYAQEYSNNVRNHLRESILQHLPSNLQDLNEANTMPKPDLDKFVFLKALENVSGVLIDDLSMDGRNEIVDMEENDLYVMRYKPIDSYVESNQIQLI